MLKKTIAGRQVGAIGLGCMGMSYAYGAGDKEGGLATLARALELGVDHWDTADLYGAGENETLLSKALRGHRDEVFLATKFGNVYDRTLTTHQDQVQAGAGWIVDGTPEYAKAAIDRSLQRLGVDHVDLYYLHRIDPKVPVEETIGAMAEIVQAGKARAIGISEANAETISRAHATHPLAAVQNELSLWTQDFLKHEVPLCRQLGIAFVPYSPLGRGFLTGALKNLDDLSADDWRRNNPRFQGEALQANLRIVETVERVAARRSVKPSQVALAWALAQGDHVCPIPGTKRVEYLEENVAAADIELTAEDLADLNSVPSPTGERYAEDGMKFVAA